jgi:dolichol-phosphate mannosyltransferase
VVIIPTFNEKANLRPLIEAISRLDFLLDVLIVDDRSPDGTGELADRIAETHSHVRVFHRPWRTGLGRAYAQAFRRVLDEGYLRILQMDADFSHDPAQIPLLLKALETCDFVVGSRYMKGGRTVNWAPYRLLLSKAATWFVRLVIGGYFTDATSGFKCFRREVLEAVELQNLQSLGYVFQVEVNFLARREGFRMKEVPIRFVDRVRGSSKLNMGMILEAVRLVLGLRFPRWSLLSHAVRKRRRYGAQRRTEYTKSAEVGPRSADSNGKNRTDSGDRRWMHRRDGGRGSGGR